MSLTHSQKMEYERDGFLLVEGLLTVAEIETLRVRGGGDRFGETFAYSARVDA